MRAMATGDFADLAIGAVEAGLAVLWKRTRGGASRLWHR